MKEVHSLAKELKGVFGWHQARVALLAQFIIALVKVRSTNLTQLAQVFIGVAQPTSHYKRLQRFLREFKLDYDKCARVLAKCFCPDTTWVLCLDRTNWQFGSFDINFLVLAVAHKKLAIPLFWVALPKRGNSNTHERKALINRFLRVFGVEKTAYLTADREFIGKDWLDFLVKRQIPFCLRIRNNTRVWNKHRNQKFPVERLFALQNGERMTLNKPRTIWGISVFLSCIRGERGRVIVATNGQAKQAIERYAVRWSIESLFGCLKSRGFDLEATHLRDYERLNKLFFVLAFAFGWCFKLGIWFHQLKPIKLKKHGRRSKSLFRLGMDYLHQALLGSAGAQMFRSCMRVLSCT